MHPLYEAAIEVVEQLRTIRLEVVRLSAELAQTEYDLRLAQARIERGLIKRVAARKHWPLFWGDKTHSSRLF